MKSILNIPGNLIAYIKEVFSSSNEASMKRWLALLSFMYAVRLVERGLHLADDKQGHIMYYTEAFLVLCGLMMGVSAMEKMPKATDIINAFRKKKQEPDPAPPAPTNGGDEELKDVDPEEENKAEPQPEVKPEPAPQPQPQVQPQPSPVIRPKVRSKELFVRTYYPYAVQSQQQTGINADFVIAQKGLETGWKLDPPGWNFGGIKAARNTPANKKQLLTTHEVLATPSAKFPKIISVTKIGKRQYRYKVKDWFRRYNDPVEAFADHAQFFLKNKRYTKALQVRQDANQFAEAIAKAGYASDPAYAFKLKKAIADVQKIIRTT